MPKKRRKKTAPSPHPTIQDFLNPVGRFIVPPPNPPGFGITRPELAAESPLITGEILFDDPFYNVLAPPPLGSADPCYPEYQYVLTMAENRINKCPPGQETEKCRQAREDYFIAARAYAYCLDRTWGLNRFAEEAEQFYREQAAKKKQKKRT